MNEIEIGKYTDSWTIDRGKAITLYLFSNHGNKEMKCEKIFLSQSSIWSNILMHFLMLQSAKLIEKNELEFFKKKCNIRKLGNH